MTNTEINKTNEVFIPYKYQVHISTPWPKTIYLLLSRPPTDDDIKYVQKRVSDLMYKKDQEEIARCIEAAYVSAFTERDIVVFPDLNNVF